MDRVNRSTGTFKRTNSNLVELDNWHPGPFVGIVRNNLDPEYKGRLEVELLTKTKVGNIPQTASEWFTCKYLSPFYGKTPAEGVRPNEEDKYSQKSYGMWFVPPDIGTKVLVILAEGGEAFWMGCIVDDDINFMIPATDTATTYNTEDGDVKLPVGERNIRQELTGNDYTQMPKPVHSDFKNILEQQGLLGDETRGINSSSSRRDVPSAVFGISTPGPQDKRENAHTISTQSGSHKYHNRLGGSSFVMDDGDPSLLRKNSASTAPPEYANLDKDDSGGNVTIPHNEMLRLKTRTGHQILMHNAEDLIYIGNAKGTAWVELTANGKIDIYSEDSISVHSQTDINFRADRDINLEAGRDFNLRSARDTQFDIGNDLKVTVGANSKITTKSQLDINTGSASYITSGQNIEILSKQGDIVQQTAADGKKIFWNGPDATEAQTQSPLQAWTLPGDPRDPADVRPISSILRRVPQHEPWTHHENLAPLNFTPTETDIKKPEERTGQGITPFAPNEGEFTTTADTFRKGKD